MQRLHLNITVEAVVPQFMFKLLTQDPPDQRTVNVLERLFAEKLVSATRHSGIGIRIKDVTINDVSRREMP
jgi:hypothetical protein